MLQLKQQELQLQAMEIQGNLANKKAELINDAQELANDQVKMQMEAQENNINNFVQMQKAAAEVKKAALNSTLDVHNNILKEQNQSHQHGLATSKHVMELNNQAHNQAKDVINMQNQQQQQSDASTDNVS
jgi:hypothetical protein